MDGLIKAIKNARETEKKVEYYFTMTVDEKHELFSNLAKEKTEDIGIFLNAVYPDEPDKDIRKLIRKMIFRLRSSGVNVQEPGKEGQSVLRKIEEARDNRGYLTNFDYAQSRMVMAAYEVRKNTFVFLNGEVHFREGLRELMSTPLDRKNLDDLFRAYRENTVEPAFMVEISPAYAAYIVEEGSRMSGRFTDAVGSLRSFAAHIKDAVVRPEHIYTLPIKDDIPASGVQDILSHPVFTPFSLAWETIDEDRKTYHSQADSAIVLPQHMIEEKRGSFVDELIRREPIGSQVPHVRRMLEDYAYLLYKMGDHGRCRGIIAVLRADDLFKQAMISFIRKSLETPQDKNTGSTGLIVNPYG
ncbi:MAG: hypothetical protein H6Q52_29 [Deltaproteobacteria bacterium]|nr:hypothetical protein [Deltaproteobacteria bacterium]